MGDNGVFERLAAIFSGESVKSQNNDDKVDRMNHVWTVFLLIIFSVLTLTTQYVGDPIKCWAPAQFSDAWVDYTNNVCWISNTYYVPMSETIPVAHATREDKEITYYQWTPIILLLIALMFKIPNVLWNRLNDYVGVDIDKIVRMAVDTQWDPHEKREENVDNLAEFMHLWVSTYRPYKKGKYYSMKLKLARFCGIFFAKRTGNYLTSLYVTIKILYCINVVAVFFVLNKLMSFEFGVFGFEILDYLAREGEVKEIPIFPRVTLCDFEIRQLQNILRYSVQCVLPVNLFNEKIFIVLWFWFFIVACATFVNLLVWINRIISYRNGPEYVKKHLKISGLLKSQDDKDLCKLFIIKYLRPDGIFVLRMMEKNASDIIVQDIVIKLYKKFIKEREKRNGYLMDSNRAKPVE